MCLCCDLRPDARQIAFRLLIGLRGRNPAGEQLGLAIEFAMLEVFQRPQVIQRGNRFFIVETGKKIPCANGFTFASATFDNAAPDKGARA